MARRSFQTKPKEQWRVGIRIWILKLSEDGEFKAPILLWIQERRTNDRNPYTQNSKELSMGSFGHDSLTNWAISQIIHICLTQPKLGSIVHSHRLQTTLFVATGEIPHQADQKQVKDVTHNNMTHNN